MLDVKTLPRLIDLSCVRTDSTKQELESMVALAKKHNFVCCFAMPAYTDWLLSKLGNEKEIAVGGTVGFPSGAEMTMTKASMAKYFVERGCREVDMVINVSALKSGEYDFVKSDILAVREATEGVIMKTILEVGYLTDDEICRASEIAVSCGVDFVKTGTGWASPTTLHHIELIKKTVGNRARIKAAGGVRTLQDIENMVNAGVSRFGISLRSTLNILKEAGLEK